MGFWTARLTPGLTGCLCVVGRTYNDLNQYPVFPWCALHADRHQIRPGVSTRITMQHCVLQYRLCAAVMQYRLCAAVQIDHCRLSCSPVQHATIGFAERELLPLASMQGNRGLRCGGAGFDGPRHLPRPVQARRRAQRQAPRVLQGAISGHTLALIIIFKSTAQAATRVKRGSVFSLGHLSCATQLGNEGWVPRNRFAAPQPTQDPLCCGAGAV